MDGEYKYCPRCGAEYDKDIKECADCFVPLVSGLEYEDIKANKSDEKASSIVVHITGDPDEAGDIAAALGEEGIAAKVESVDTKAEGLTFRPGALFHVVVSAEDEEKAQFILQYKILPPPAAEPEDSLESGEAGERLERAIEAGAEGLDALVEFFGDEPSFRHDAVQAALELGDDGFDAVIEWVKKICEEGELGPGGFQVVGDACMFLANENCGRAAGEFAPGIESPESWMRKNFTFALGKLGCDAAVAFLVSALRDPAPEVRNEAIDHLYRIEQTDYGFDPDIEPERQPESLARWNDLASGL